MKTAHALGIMVSLLTALSVALYLLAQCRNKTPGCPRPLIVCSDWRPPALISSPHSQAGARPNLIYLSYRSAETVPGYIWDQFRTYAPHYDIQFYDDERCLRSLRPFGESVLRCYQSLTEPAHRCDLWRYCMLYQTGGVYLDIKTILTRPVSEMFPHPRMAGAGAAHSLALHPRNRFSLAGILSESILIGYCGASGSGGRQNADG